MNITAKIFASDLDSSAIEKARRGIYNEGITASVSGERLEGSLPKQEHFLRSILI